MGKFADVFKNAIFVQEDDKDSKNSKKEKPSLIPKPEATPDKKEGQEVTIKPTSSAGKIDDGYLNMLEEKLEQENIPGPDYLELKHAAMSEEMVKEEPDEGKRYRQAFSSMRQFFPGVDEERIFSSIRHYKQVMETEKKDALEDLERKIQEQVVAFQQKIKTEEEKLEEQQQALDKRRAALESEKKAVLEREEALNNKSKDFVATIDFVIGTIDDDDRKLKEYLKK